MKVTWTVTAIWHLERIHEYVSTTSPTYASLLIERILQRGAQLATFPNSGRIVVERQRDDIRDVVEPTYRIIYQVTTTGVYVAVVIHGRQEKVGPLP